MEREEAKRRDEEFKKMSAKGMSLEEFDVYYKELMKKEQNGGGSEE